MTRYVLRAGSVPASVTVTPAGPGLKPSHMLGILPGSHNQPFRVEGNQDPAGAVAWAKRLNAKCVVPSIGQHNWINVDMTDLWGQGKVVEGGSGGSRQSLENFADAFAANGIYFMTMFHTGYGAMYYHYEFAADEIKQRLLELADRIGDLWQDNAYWLGIAWDFEYSGFNAANAHWPGVWANNYEYQYWLFNKASPDGFMARIWAKRPDALFFAYPAPSYCDTNIFGRYYDMRVGTFVNHQNFGHNEVGYWDNIGYADRTLHIHGVSADQGDLAWHVGNVGEDEWHTWGYRANWKKVDSSPLDGLPQHFLETLLYNPWIHTVTWFPRDFPTPCPYCGDTQASLSPEEEAFLVRIGAKLATIPYSGPNMRFAMGGDLDWPGDGIGRYNRQPPFPILGSDSNPYVTITSVRGIRWSLTADLQLWLVNPCLEPATTTVTWAGHDPMEVTVGAMDFEVLYAPADVPIPWHPNYVEPENWQIKTYSPI